MSSCILSHWQVLLAIIMILVSTKEVQSGFRTTCGDDETENKCVPENECKIQHNGHCGNLQCCKNKTYTVLPPLAGDCKCVSDLNYCDLLPFPYQHGGLNCVCCDCDYRCVHVQYKNDIELCPTFEKPAGSCDDNKNTYCCPIEEARDVRCDCFERCPKAWTIIGHFGKCCVF